jgi:hypothetical protein
LVVALALYTSATSAGPTREDAEACAQRVERDEPIAQQDSVCRAATEAFKAQPGAGNQKIGADALRDWAMILPAAPDPAAARQALPDPATVGNILARLDQEQSTAPLSLWERFRRWIHSLFDLQQERGRAPAWLIRLIDALTKIPPRAVKTMFWSGVAILAAMLLGLIVIELRASGLLGGQPRRRQRPGSPLSSTSRVDVGVPDLMLDDIARLAPELRAAALLRWLLRALSERHLLTSDRALTNRELASRLPPALAAGFQRFIACIEPALFGGRSLQDEGFAEARALASGLTTASGRAAAGAAQVAARHE